MNQEIKYIGFYDFSESKNRRVSSSAATNKMNYICDAINRAGFSIHLISPSWFEDSVSNMRYESQTTIQLDRQKKITFCPNIGTTYKWTRNIKIVLSLMWLFFWLIRHTKKNEKVLVYHSPWLSIPIQWAKSIKRFKLILEVEEVYGDVSSINSYFDVLESKLLNSADSFLFSTDLLANKVGGNKPFLVIYGIYQSFEKLASPPDDGKIHLLYAGIIDTHKAGAFNAIECARFLTENYILHIIGFGDTGILIQRIEDINKASKCKVVFDGAKNGIEYIKYCQRCHIGLSTQKMDGKYLETSFPSKVLSYLSLGLNVVSCYVDCVAKSQIHPLITYYYKDSPEYIAKAILDVDLNSIDNCKETIKKLDKRFVSVLKTLIQN